MSYCTDPARPSLQYQLTLSCDVCLDWKKTYTQPDVLHFQRGGEVRPFGQSHPGGLITYHRWETRKSVVQIYSPLFKIHKTIEMISQRLECWYVFYAVPDESNAAVQILLEDTLQDVARVQLEWSLLIWHCDHILCIHSAVRIPLTSCFCDTLYNEDFSAHVRF